MFTESRQICSSSRSFCVVVSVEMSMSRPLLVLRMCLYVDVRASFLSSNLVDGVGVIVCRGILSRCMFLKLN